MAAVESPVPAAVTESKSARKKKAKAEAAAAANGTHNNPTAVPEVTSKDESTMADSDSTADHPYIKELQKQIRNVNKKLTAMHKLDAILAENPGVSLDDLVAQRKINADQKAAAQKKPQLAAQLADLEERQEHYRKFDADYQIKFNKQREDLTSQHQQDVEKLRQELRIDAVSASSTELRKKLLIFSQFLRAAAAKRGIEEEADTEESRAFEGALLLVYGGDQKAVETAVNLIEGSDQQVPSVEGILTPVTFKQVKQAALDHAPFQTEEAWVDQVAEATSGDAPTEPDAPLVTSDPTITHAGLTEIDALTRPNGIEKGTEAISAAPVSAGDVGNVAGEQWDTDAVGAGAEKTGLEESFEMIPRPSEEVDVPGDSSTVPGVSRQPQGTSWADEPTQETTTGVGNQASETWDTKAPGDQSGGEWAAAEPTAPNSGSVQASTETAVNDDGFSQVPGRHRGRGGYRGRGGDGEGRGRGRGRGNFRGRGDGESRGARGGYRGSRGDGEFRGSRGGGGRGRGAPRGGVSATAES